MLHEAKWRKSSRSADTNCVEVAFVPAVVAVRDSKNSAGPVLTFPAEAWTALLQER